MTGAVLVDHEAAHEVAEAYRDAPVRLGTDVVAAYARLADEPDRLFDRITAPDRPDRVRVVFTTCPAPDRGAGELVDAVRTERLLEVVTVAGHLDRRHPLMGREAGGAYDRFRLAPHLVRRSVGAARPGVAAPRPSPDTSTPTRTSTHTRRELP